MRKYRTFEKPPLEGNVYETAQSTNEEITKKLEEIRRKTVITEEEVKIAKEQKLLKSLYECQDLMEELLEEGIKDPHYTMISTLIQRLELHLQGKQDLT